MTMLMMMIMMLIMINPTSPEQVWGRQVHVQPLGLLVVRGEPEPGGHGDGDHGDGDDGDGDDGEDDQRHNYQAVGKRRLERRGKAMVGKEALGLTHFCHRIFAVDDKGENY